MFFILNEKLIPKLNIKPYEMSIKKSTNWESLEARKRKIRGYKLKNRVNSKILLPHSVYITPYEMSRTNFAFMKLSATIM